MYIGIQVLKAKVRGFYAEGATIRRQFSRATGKKRELLWQRKRALGNACRLHLIALGLLRGNSYESMEARCDPRNAPDVSMITMLIKEHSSGLTQPVIRGALEAAQRLSEKVASQ